MNRFANQLSGQGQEQLLKVQNLAIMGRIYGEWGKIPDALKYTHAAYHVSILLADKKSQAQLLNQLSHLYLKNNQSKEAFGYAKSSLLIAKEVNLKEDQNAAIDILIKISESKGYFKSALIYERMHQFNPTIE